jgi:hypothetical protein
MAETAKDVLFISACASLLLGAPYPVSKDKRTSGESVALPPDPRRSIMPSSPARRSGAEAGGASHDGR